MTLFLIEPHENTKIWTCGISDVNAAQLQPIKSPH